MGICRGGKLFGAQDARHEILMQRSIQLTTIISHFDPLCLKLLLLGSTYFSSKQDRKVKAGTFWFVHLAEDIFNMLIRRESVRLICFSLPHTPALRPPLQNSPSVLLAL